MNVDDYYLKPISSIKLQDTDYACNCARYSLCTRCRFGHKTNIPKLSMQKKSSLGLQHVHETSTVKTLKNVTLLIYNFKLKLFLLITLLDFAELLTDFSYTNFTYRPKQCRVDALDRLRVHLNIILLFSSVFHTASG